MTDVYIEHIHGFCNTLKIISTDLMRRFPQDPMVYRAHKRIITIIGIDPKLVIDICGPYLYQYRDKIYSDDVDESSSFFIENDYDREITRKYIFIALLSGISHLHENDIVLNEIDNYLNIPQNNIVFYDFVYKNVKINYDSKEKIINFAAQFNEILIADQIIFEAHFVQIDNLENYFGHVVVDAQCKAYKCQNKYFPVINEIATFNLGDDIKIVNGNKV